MNQYVTGAVIKELREKNNVTQLQLADKIGVSDKTISKWETGKGYPDITLLEPIANALSVSVAELISGNTVYNSNVSANMLRSKFYICPVCGNVIHGMGEAVIHCHGVLLQPEIAQNMSDGVNFFFPGFEGTKEEGLRLIVDKQLSPSVLARSAYCESRLARERKNDTD